VNEAATAGAGLLILPTLGIYQTGVQSGVMAAYVFLVREYERGRSRLH
jgi:hypothetical protein